MSLPLFTDPGILWVTSKITHPDHLSEQTYLNWYDNEHIPEVLSVTPIASLLRFRNLDPNAERPYLATCPLQDMADGGELRKVSVKSEKLPDDSGVLGGSSHDCADLDYRFYQLIQKYEPNGSEATLGKTKTIVTGGFDMGPEVSEQEFHDWYDKEHLELLSQLPGYLRTTRYKLLNHRTNAEARAIKGLPSRPNDTAIEKTEPPMFHAVHEFSIEELDNEAAMKTIGTERAKRIFSNATKSEYAVYRLEKSFGDGKFHH
ncbi:uncharacterized protein LY89DRAFT_725586 [Mollisia scopiformis]|uniref:EthD domain-containing protein n=1 Tax=Mollisia scopiformis TaxID=149040 RepID=A0A132B785_MOLSC|nr:uncharacterized protein LY89DRAFT_725586 [Mollisia scopiformis]KUJ07859.1 hypothetical protein LY89DRAFT_725586 [Mollisia scopiformis]